MPSLVNQLSAMIQDMWTDENYFSKVESISKHVVFRYLDDTQFNDVAINQAAEQPLDLRTIGRVVRRATYLSPGGTYRPSGVREVKLEELDVISNSRLRVSLAPPRKSFVKARIVTEDWARYRSTFYRQCERMISGGTDNDYVL